MNWSEPRSGRGRVRALLCATVLAVTISAAAASPASAVSVPPWLQKLLHIQPSPSPSPPLPGVAPSATPAGGAGQPDLPVSPSPSLGQQAMPATPTGNTALLSSDSLQVTNLRSLAVTTVTAAAGTVKVIQLKADAATINGLNLVGPCNAGVQLHVMGTQQVVSGGLTINATALQLTVLGVQVTLNAGSLPATPALKLPGVTLPALPTNTAFLTVKMDVALVSAGAATISGLHETRTAC